MRTDAADGGHSLHDNLSVNKLLPSALDDRSGDFASLTKLASRLTCISHPKFLGPFWQRTIPFCCLHSGTFQIASFECPFCSSSRCSNGCKSPQISTLQRLSCSGR